LAEDAKCQFPEYVPMYMENFCRLGLAELEYHASLSDAALYQRILDAPYIVTLRKEIQEQQRMPKAIKGIFSLTTMGMLFNNACLEVGV
jgi:hypothetical protein